MTDYQAPHLPKAFTELERASRIMQGFAQFWCVCGGWAIDPFINRLSRPHKDVDFAIWRRDQLALRAYLTAQGWTLEKAVAGQLLPWAEGEFIPLPTQTIWCKNPNVQPDFIEILFNEADERDFLYRRNPSIRRRLADATLRIESGPCILAPEIVLLYKANDPPQERARSDFENGLPSLDAARRAWLKEALLVTHPDHEWLRRL